jgi:hypothetical protein
VVKEVREPRNDDPIVNPGAGANTPGMAEECGLMSREAAPRLVEPDEMVPPLLHVVARSHAVNGWL